MAFCVSFRTRIDGNFHVKSNQYTAEVEKEKRGCIVATAQNLVGKVVEKTGRNDHPMIDTFFVTIGQKNLVKAPWNYKPYCAAFTGYCLINCGVAPPIKTGIASVRQWETAKSRFKELRDTLPADVVTYTTWSHQEIVKDFNPNPRLLFFTSIGANTEDPKGSGKYGVWEKRRQKKHIKRVIDTV